jgi:hypothetical protein
MLSPDGTVLECLRVNSQALLTEMRFANELNNLWLNPKLSRAQKEYTVKHVHLAHLKQHPPGMVKGSQMQGFDQKYEAGNRLRTSDTIANPEWITPNMLCDSCYGGCAGYRPTGTVTAATLKTQ